MKNRLNSDNTKNKIYNICLKNINSVNSFVDNEGNNYFETMVNQLTQYVIQEVIGLNEALGITINSKTIHKKNAAIRNLFRKDMRKIVLSPINELETK